MGAAQIFGLQFTLSLTVYALVAAWYVWPRLALLPQTDALVPLLLLHALRHLGLSLLVQGMHDPSLPREFAITLGYGDLVAGLLALLSIIALRMRWPVALPLVWFFNIWGTLDLLYATFQGLRLDVPRFDLGAAWYIPTFFMPALLVTHFMIFLLLLRRPR